MLKKKILSCELTDNLSNQGTALFLIAAFLFGMRWVWVERVSEKDPGWVRPMFKSVSWQPCF